MRTKSINKLNINEETVANLENREMEDVRGGMKNEWDTELSRMQQCSESQNTSVLSCGVICYTG